MNRTTCQYDCCWNQDI